MNNIETLSDDFKKYLIIDKKYSENTIKSYQNDLKKFAYHFKIKNIENISESDIKNYIKEIKNQYEAQKQTFRQHFF